MVCLNVSSSSNIGLFIENFHTTAIKVCRHYLTHRARLLGYTANIYQQLDKTFVPEYSLYYFQSQHDVKLETSRIKIVSRSYSEFKTDYKWLYVHIKAELLNSIHQIVFVIIPQAYIMRSLLCDLESTRFNLYEKFSNFIAANPFRGSTAAQDMEHFYKWTEVVFSKSVQKNQISIEKAVLSHMKLVDKNVTVRINSQHFGSNSRLALRQLVDKAIFYIKDIKLTMSYSEYKAMLKCPKDSKARTIDYLYTEDCALSAYLIAFFPNSRNILVNTINIMDIVRGMSPEKTQHRPLGKAINFLRNL